MDQLGNPEYFVQRKILMIRWQIFMIRWKSAMCSEQILNKKSLYSSNETVNPFVRENMQKPK